jgi:hypothetical protein
MGLLGGKALKIQNRVSRAIAGVWKYTECSLVVGIEKKESSCGTDILLTNVPSSDKQEFTKSILGPLDGRYSPIFRSGKV